MRKQLHSYSMYRETGLAFLILLFFFAAIRQLPAHSTAALDGAVIYVKHDASGSGNGSSWANAFPDLQDAINAAAVGDEIWIAAGVYLPTADKSGNSSPADIREKTFYINKDIQIYGGFNGTETNKENRDVENNRCVLSGDLAGDDTDTDGNGVAEDYTHIQGSNAYHILLINDVSADMVLDGCWITGGKADNASIGSGTEGGGALIRSTGYNETSPTITQSQFWGNYANYAGGALSLLGNGDGMGDKSTISPNLSHCTFAGNNSSTGPGAQIEAYNDGVCKPVFTECTFKSNLAAAGTILCRAKGRNSIADGVFDRCYFIDNQATGFGGAFWLEALDAATLFPNITNSIIEGNEAQKGGVAHIVAKSGSSNISYFINCTIVKNSATASGSVFSFEDSLAICTPYLFNSICYGNTGTLFEQPEVSQLYVANSIFDISSLPPSVSDFDNLFDTNPGFNDFAGGDYTLQACSPAVDVGGNNNFLPAKDMAGNVRLANKAVDAGAFELANEVIPPTVMTQDITVQLDSDGLASIVPGDIDNGSFDNCSLDNLALNNSSFSCANLGVQSVQLTAMDNWSNTTSGTATVTVMDVMAPQVITKNISIELDENGMATLSADQVDNGSEDNCGISQRSINTTTFSCDHLGEQVVSLMVEDASGNENSANAIVTIVDATAPVVKLVEAITVTLDTDGLAALDIRDVDNGSTDNCSIAARQLNQSSFDCNQLGVQTIVYTVTDGGGNEASQSLQVTVEDELLPTVVTQNIIVQLDSNGQASIETGDIDNGSFDNCSLASLSLDKTSFDCSNLGGNTVQLTIKDFANNSKTGMANVAVMDTIAPQAVSKNIEIEIDENGMANFSADQLDNGSFDNCGISERTVSTSSFSCDQLGEHMVSLTVKDASGNQTSVNATVTVVDAIVPEVITKNIEIEIDENGMASLSADQLDDGSSDNCGISERTVSMNSFSCDQLGEHTVSLTVVDARGNQTSANATVTVVDAIAPVVNIVEEVTVTLDENGEATLEVGDVENGSTDNCEVANRVIDRTDFSCNNMGNNVVTLRVTDSYGNAASKTATVVVKDEIEPEAKANEVTVYLDENGGINLSPEQVDDNSTDNCGIVNRELDKTSFSCNNIGQNMVKLTVADAFGNAVSAETMVNVLDTTAPEVVGKDISIDIVPGKDTTLKVDQVLVLAWDNCTIDSYELSNYTFTDEMAGPQEITLTVTDVSGNTTTVTVVVTVNMLTSTTTLAEAQSLNADVFPNPVSDELTIWLDQLQIGKTVDLELINPQGKRLKKRSFTAPSVRHQAFMPMAELPSGLYWIKIVQDKAYHLVPVIKQ